ncbi:EAL domain-containing protein [Metabacillus sp. YM-086]|uniref:sensor domain-containing protein n=1 Tax=Metabacillus sp. YM-086 TaxID=3341729 RepID=UPI001B969A99
MNLFFNFHIFDVVVVAILAILTCKLGFEYSTKIKLVTDKKELKKKLFLFSSVVGLGFWLTYTYAFLSVDVPIVIEQNYFLLLFVYLLCFLGAYFTLFMARAKEFKWWKYIISSIVVSMMFIGITTLGYWWTFRELIYFKPVSFGISCLIIGTCIFKLMKFLRQITNEEEEVVKKSWLNIGAILCGVSISGIPYLLLTSLLDFKGVLQYEYKGYTYLLPFLYPMLSNFLLMILPDIISDRMLSTTTVKYKSLFSHNPNAVFSVDLKGKIMDVNKETLKLVGYTREELIGKELFSLLQPNLDKQTIIKKVKSGSIEDVETVIVTKDQRAVDIKITTMRIVINNETIGYYGIAKDITEDKKAKQMIHRLAFYDELTGLYNRRKLIEILNEWAANGEEFHLLLLDFDRFKRINDSFGHSFGDQLLKEISIKLKHFTEKKGVVGRLGGDEFLIMLPLKETQEGYLEELVDCFRKPLNVEGVDVISTASIGISTHPHHSTNLTELVKYADIAMYHTKENGSNGYSFFSESMLENKFKNIAIENELRYAIDHNHISVYLQPKYNMVSGELIGAESLARWKHSTHGMIAPNVFIPLAEEIGEIDRLEKKMIKEVCGLLSTWIKKGKKIHQTSINISLPTLLHDGFIPFVSHTLIENQLNGSFLEFEITERIVMKYETEVNSRLQQLRNMGIEISIDDFGTGYSSLSYLYKLEVDRLKIDKMFVDQCVENSEVVSMIISMAKALGLQVIAEGVEDENQIRILKKLGCIEAQGFYFSRPVPHVEFQELLEEYSTADF